MDAFCHLQPLFVNIVAEVHINLEFFLQKCRLNCVFVILCFVFCSDCSDCWDCWDCWDCDIFARACACLCGVRAMFRSLLLFFLVSQLTDMSACEVHKGSFGFLWVRVVFDEVFWCWVCFRVFSGVFGCLCDFR